SKVYKSFSANASNLLGDSGANVSGEIVQFYPNMRYKDKRISYSLESVCSQKKWENVEEAFSILTERTILSFYHSSDNPEITVLCSEVSPKSEEKGHFVAGEGGPSEIINTTNFAVILNGRISLYRDEKCDEPNIAIHEILHALGFDHYNNPKSILYPVTGCNQEIDSEIISDINRLYSLDSLPDLTIESLNANRTGRYLNFDINISNIGLAESVGARLNIYKDSDRIANFTLGDLDVGVKRLLFVQNLRIPGGSDNLLFEVESDDSGELSFANNRAEISLV
ncbi:MAG TPA: matrixin family metalloprotease, partial [Candidatus Nanoarchaeia archaeon]|nr:matrixin family metalloprotease [Candidatus Nanoarchaeia archaeon]